MKFHTEIIEYASEYEIKTENKNQKIRVQVIEDEEINIFYDILCNDRFKPDDFEALVFCELCTPKFVPKVIELDDHRFCKACLTKLIKAIDVAFQDDCAQLDRIKSENLQKILED
jgi:hypothetical protein